MSEVLDGANVDFLTQNDAGALRSCDPDRVILKRIVLSGYPVRVHKKKAVVRWMFHHPDDVRWFRPLELWTKHGLRGRIKVPFQSLHHSDRIHCYTSQAREDVPLGDILVKVRRWETGGVK